MPWKHRKVLLLEAQLDSDIGSLRSQREFMRLLGTTYESENVAVTAKEVHSRADMKYFLDLASKDSEFKLINFVGHGEATSNVLTNGDRIDLSARRDLSMFRGLDGKIILLSCCGIGKEQKAN